MDQIPKDDRQNGLAAFRPERGTPANPPRSPSPSQLKASADVNKAAALSLLNTFRADNSVNQIVAAILATKANSGDGSVDSFLAVYNEILEKLKKPRKSKK